MRMSSSRSDFKDDPTSNTGERSGRDRRCEDLAMLNGKDIVARAFCDEALFVKHKTLARASLLRLDLARTLLR